MKKKDFDHWDNRVMVTKQKKELIFQVHEVHYNSAGKATHYTKEGVAPQSTTYAGLDFELDLFKRAFEKPVLWAGKQFPKVWKK